MGLVFTWLPPAAAQARPVPIDLPAQLLSQALAALSKQAGVEIIAQGELVAGRQAPAVRGTMTPSAALERLLAGSGLEAVPAPGGGFVVRRVAQVPVEEQRLPEVTVRGREIVESAFGPVPGYRASRSATATRTDVPIGETPASIQVIPDR
ncbi:secretin and TonB N-terminal domain-containing protein [Pelomicrobium sp. G1]|uniref:STN domain-containing protein n=1 Tax=unclassified Pelomicrobium TaxID=2815318 RepID=UPI003F7666A5